MLIHRDEKDLEIGKEGAVITGGGRKCLEPNKTTTKNDLSLSHSAQGPASFLLSQNTFVVFTHVLLFMPKCFSTYRRNLCND